MPAPKCYRLETTLEGLRRGRAWGVLSTERGGQLRSLAAAQRALGAAAQSALQACLSSVPLRGRVMPAYPPPQCSFAWRVWIKGPSTRPGASAWQTHPDVVTLPPQPARAFRAEIAADEWLRTINIEIEDCQSELAQRKRAAMTKAITFEGVQRHKR